MKVKVNVLKPWSLAATHYAAGTKDVEIDVVPPSKEPLPDTTLTDAQYTDLVKKKVIEPTEHDPETGKATTKK